MKTSETHNYIVLGTYYLIDNWSGYIPLLAFNPHIGLIKILLDSFGYKPEEFRNELMVSYLPYFLYTDDRQDGNSPNEVAFILKIEENGSTFLAIPKNKHLLKILRLLMGEEFSIVREFYIPEKYLEPFNRFISRVEFE